MKVIETRHTDYTIRRRRKCVVCGERLTTREVILPNEYMSLLRPQDNGRSVNDNKYSAHYCQECKAELTAENIINARDRICLNCKWIKYENWHNRKPTHPYNKKLPDDLDLIAQLYETKTLKEIGEIYNVDGEAVRQQLKKAGVKLRPVGKPRVNKVDDQKVVELYRQTSNMVLVAQELGLSPSTISAHLAKLGIDTSPAAKPIGCPNCATKPYAKGLCHNCYERARRRG